MMTDIWGFLLQTLTASGTAVLLLIIKALFKDKLPPKWHFAVWGTLGLILLIPAGWNENYILINWRFLVELIKSFVEDFSFTRVIFPFPVILTVPHTPAEWIFTVYTAGVILHLAVYLFSYVKLRFILSKGKIPSCSITEKVRQLSAELNVKPCRVIEVSGLPSAFVCGIIKPVLVVPAIDTADDKIFIHELMHLKSRDTLYSVIICILRSIHWCNPLIIYCANSAVSDMEHRCDQFVLEHLKGEERRDYGRILLSMVNDRFTKTPATTCINNGGKHIRSRIETIARFKKYPVGMGLVSVCSVIILTFSLINGVQTSEVYRSYDSSPSIKLAQARSVSCTTPAGAFDTYAKAVLKQNGYYRIMCAPTSLHKKLFKTLINNIKNGYPEWDLGISASPDTQYGYYIYNLKKCSKNAYEGLLVIKLHYFPEDEDEDDAGSDNEKMQLAVQNVRVEKQSRRWVAVPLESFHITETYDQSLEWGCTELSGTIYSGIYGDFRANVKVQTIYAVENTVQYDSFIFQPGSIISLDVDPKPHTQFTRASKVQSESITYLGKENKQDKIETVGLSVAAVYKGEKRPEKMPEKLPEDGISSSGVSSNGESWSSVKTDFSREDTVILNCGGGASIEPELDVLLPEYYAADLYVNNKLLSRLDLHLQKGIIE